MKLSEAKDKKACPVIDKIWRHSDMNKIIFSNTILKIKQIFKEDSTEIFAKAYGKEYQKKIDALKIQKIFAITNWCIGQSHLNLGPECPQKLDDNINYQLNWKYYGAVDKKYHYIASQKFVKKIIRIFEKIQKNPTGFKQKLAIFMKSDKVIASFYSFFKLLSKEDLYQDQLNIDVDMNQWKRPMYGDRLVFEVMKKLDGKYYVNLLRNDVSLYVCGVGKGDCELGEMVRMLKSKFVKKELAEKICMGEEELNDM